MNQAKQAGKLNKAYSIPEEFRNNTPASYKKILKKYKPMGHFKPFPFGTDLTDREIKVGGALKRLKAQMGGGLLKVTTLLIKALLNSPDQKQKELLSCLKLDQPQNFKEKIYQKLVTTQL